MKAVILAGGLGTRFSEETSVRPKPMIEIGGKPILWHIMKIYSAHGINDFVVCCGYKGYVIKEYFANYFLHTSDVTFRMGENRMEVHQRRGEPWNVTLVDTGDTSMTGGRLKRVAEHVAGEDAFCMTYGDGVGDVDITALIAFHRQHGRQATLTAAVPPGRFGALEMEGDRITSFLEKPEGDGAAINAGYFVLSPVVLDRIADDATIWEQEPLRGLAADGELMAYRHRGFWQPMDTLRDKIHLEELWGGGCAVEELVMTVDPDFWTSRKVFLTGHTGFKGSWLALWLQAMGAEVRGYALRPSTSPALFDEARVAEGMESEFGDIRDLESLKASMVAFAPEIVIHMAAQPLVRASYDDPVGTYATNVMGTVNVLEGVRACSAVRAVVSVTTDKCYENREWVWGYRENEAMGGHDPYSSSKGCAELVTAAYRRSFFAGDGATALASARAGNVIGGGDWATDRLVPDILRALERGEAVRIRNPLSTRPWQHVLEPLSGYLVLAQALATGGQAHAEGWNFGPRDEDARPVDWIVEAMASRWPEARPWQRDEGFHPHEANWLKLDISKAGQRLHWGPRWSLGEALDRIVHWHRAWLNGADARQLCLTDIAAYAGDDGLLNGGISDRKEAADAL